MTDSLIPVRRALLSVSNKTDIVPLGKALHDRQVQLISTGGTAKALREAGLPVTDVQDITQFPEMMAGRVKTLHPAVHGGLLGRRGIDDDVMAQHNIAPIDLLVLNLYPFAEVAARGGDLAELIENIDIGGPAMLRSAAKNFDAVSVLTDPDQYDTFLAALSAHDGQTPLVLRQSLAVTAFAHVAEYDAIISNTLSALNEDNERETYPDHLHIGFDKAADLRYGENPHQSAAFYREATPPIGSLATFTQHQGKALSFNNLADADTAWACVKAFDAPACVIVKHANPCGVAVAANVDAAYDKAFATDPVSAFGGIVAFNQPVDAALVTRLLDNQFVEVLIAPSYSDDAIAACRKKKNVRVLQIALPQDRAHHGFDYKRIEGGLLVQQADHGQMSADGLKVVTKIAPSDAQIHDLLFAWKVGKFVKSNAIVYAKDSQTIGIGAGQMSRVVSARIAGIKADDAKLSVPGSVMASDAFFPFRDGIDSAAQAGISAVIQPGGSIRDQEVIDAADEHGIAMVFTGMRHFRH